jgi:putative ABC transport system ATP-binding protein
VSGPTPLLRLSGVSKRYRLGEEIVAAVSDVALSVSRGELVALYGPSGSGKSTLLMLAAAILMPDSGTVVFDGRDITGLSDREAALYRRHELGMVFQSFHLVPGLPAIDNAALKLFGDGVGRTSARRQVAPLLELVGLGDRALRPPERLSVGERQRVAVARALAGSPRLILADEPTGSLDTERGDQILGLLRAACEQQGVAVLLVSHDPQSRRYADRVHSLRDGRLGEEEPGRGEEDVFIVEAPAPKGGL